jgi:hypothetical protein
MTIYLEIDDFLRQLANFATKCHPDRRNHGPFGPPMVVKNAFCPATALHGSVALPFVIPSEAEGSAVLRTIPGNVFSTERGLVQRCVAGNPGAGLDICPKPWFSRRLLPGTARFGGPLSAP